MSQRVSVPGLPRTAYGDPIDKPRDIAVAAGYGVYIAASEAGVASNPYQTGRQDSSTIAAIDLGTGRVNTFTRPRESLGLANDSAGHVFNLWFDGIYGSNPYGSPDSATVGISRIDPAPGQETILYQQLVPGLPATNYGQAAPKPAGLAVADGKAYFARSKPGTYGLNPSARDDFSTIRAIDLVAGTASDLLLFC